MTEAMLEADQASRLRRHEARRIDLLAARGIVVAAGHDHPLLEQLSTRAVWLDEGRIVADGPFAAVRAAYLAEA